MILTTRPLPSSIILYFKLMFFHSVLWVSFYILQKQKSLGIHTLKKKKKISHVKCEFKGNLSGDIHAQTKSE